jgi:histone deacetylase 1/2
MYQNHDSSSTVAYFYNYQIGKFHYGKEHPMKPKRIAMAHNLIVNYGLYRYLDVYQSREASFKELKKFHDNDYLQYLSKFISQ